MRLGLFVGYWGADMRDDSTLVVEAERLGYHSVWTAEAYGSDAITPLAFFAARTTQINLGTAVMQLPARTPAMTAATLDHLSAGRMLLGLGVSGPQVVEGWHGVPYGKPLARSREYVEIVRKMMQREAAVVHSGDQYSLPYDGDDATGLGKPLKLITHPLRATMPIYLAAVGPKNTRLSAEIADGWGPTFYSPSQAADIWGQSIAEGLGCSENPGKSFDIAPSASVAIGDDLDDVRNQMRVTIALYVGGWALGVSTFMPISSTSMATAR